MSDSEVYFHFDTKKLINAVKVRPALYSKDDPEYYNQKSHKSLIWSEVGRELVKEWDKMSQQDKVLLGHELQKRWKSLRTCFVRELGHQKEERHRREQNLPIKRRKVYSYFKHMSFLLPPGEKDHFKKASDEDSDKEEYNTSGSERSEPERPKIKRMRKKEILVKPEPTFVGDNTEFETYTSVFDHQNESQIDIDMKREEDEDRQFLLSLVPAFRKLSDKQKFDARIEILKVMKDISFKDK